MKNTKIVATIGPACEDVGILKKMVAAGMNVARLNFSHGEHAWHQEQIKKLRALSDELNEPIAILADLQGPRIRTAADEPVEVRTGERVFLAYDGGEPGKSFRLDLPGIAEAIEVGHEILIEDGLIVLTAMEKKDGGVECESKADGTILNRKGVILPDTPYHLPVLTEKDLKDLHFVLEEGVDFVGLSFVGTAQDVEDTRAEMRRVQDGKPIPQIVAKIERKEAIKNLRDIIRVTDAVMVARGDLGIEMPESSVAILQKEIVLESLAAAKPVIVATQMMKSMQENIRPTRAEVSDVSNAVIDHADAVMLSEETAMGKYPVETVAMMAEIIGKTEASPFDDLYRALDLNFRSEYAMMMRSVYEMAKSFETKAILAISLSGFTARLLSHFRPTGLLLMATDNKEIWRQSALVWGVRGLCFAGDAAIDGYIDRMLGEGKERGWLASGDKVVAFNGRTPDHETMRLIGIREVH